MSAHYETWELGTEPSSTNQWPRYNDAVLAKVFRALIELHGTMHGVFVDRGGNQPGHEPIIVRLSLPVGRREQFEQMTGFPLSEPETGGAA